MGVYVAQGEQKCAGYGEARVGRLGVAEGNREGGMIQEEVRGEAGAGITLSHRGWILF